MRPFYFALWVFISTNLWAQDSVSNNGMARITAGDYRPLYLSVDSPLVSVQPFWLDQYPVTNSAFQQFVMKNPKWQRGAVPQLFAESGYLKHWKSDFNAYRPDTADLEKPVIFVSWYAAQAFCQAQQKRLPSVAQWEYVAQASLTQKNGSQEPGYHQKILDWYAKAAKQAPAEVGKDVPNYWGVHNMHGLIWEWTEDFNSSLISGESRDDNSVNKDLYCASGSAGAVNPSDYAAFMRYSFRSSLNAKFTLGSLGFRCAADSHE